MKKLIYVVDSKKNFTECQKKQHFCNLPCEIYYFDRFLAINSSPLSILPPPWSQGTFASVAKKASAKIKI